MLKTDITIIGAGIVGLSIGSEVAGKGKDVYILERKDKFGQEQSGRNSEVIHAGIYYERDSLKARLCIEGNSLLYEICSKNGITCHKCGKIVVAINDDEIPELEKIYTKGMDNGVELQMISSREMAKLEPNLRGIEAIFLPNTGIVDSWALMKYFHARAREKGAQLAYRTEIINIVKVSDGYIITVSDADGEFSFITEILINCAGLYSDKIAELAGINLNEADYKLHWCKGEYYSVCGGKNKLLSRLIYPVPNDISVGIHVCYDVDWRLRLGPNFYYVNDINYKIDESRKKDFLDSSIMKALPFLTPYDINPETSGVMAKLQGKGNSFRDFIIEHEYKRGLPGLINLIGIDSPGLTAAPAIARYVGKLVNEILGK